MKSLITLFAFVSACLISVPVLGQQGKKQSDKAEVPFEVHMDKSVRFTERYASAMSSDSTVVILFNGDEEWLANLIRDAAIRAEVNGMPVKGMIIGKPHEKFPQSFVIYEHGRPIYRRIKADSLAGRLLYRALETKDGH